jgi:hypothetical protein
MEHLKVGVYNTYISKIVNFSTDSKSNLITLNENLSRYAVQLDTIYYDFESYRLTSLSKIE